MAQDSLEKEMQDGKPRDRSLPELVAHLSSDLSTLVSEEIALLEAELSQKIHEAARGAGMLSGAALAAFMGLGSLTALAIIALQLALDLWLAALIVTVAWFVIAGILALTGKNSVQEAIPPVPKKTIQTLKEDAEWARHPTRSVGR